VLAAAAWLIAFVTWSTEPAWYDFVALVAPRGAARIAARRSHGVFRGRASGNEHVGCEIK